MRYLFLLNPTAGKRDCTTGLTPAIHAAAGRAGIPPEKLQVVVTQYAGHARALAAEAASRCASGRRAATAPSMRR